MSIWKKRVSASNGRITIFKDGKALKPSELSDVPALVMNLEPGNTIEISGEDQAPAPKKKKTAQAKEKAKQKAHNKLFPERVSVFSGEPADKRWWLNGKEYWVTKEEKMLHTLGELAQAVREKSVDS